MQIRPATPDDVDQICDIWNPVIRDTLATFTTELRTPDSLRAMLAEKAKARMPFLLAEQGKNLLGFVTYGAFRKGPGYARTMEHTIILSPDARGRGTGAKLMQAVEAHAKNQDIHSLFAGVSAANPGAVTFHKAVGYQQVATLCQVGWKFDQWHDLVLLQKLL